jgi:hypothetical protein
MMGICFRASRMSGLQLLRSACVALFMAITLAASAGEPVKISGTLPSGGQVSGFINVSPQFPFGGAYATFIATDNTNPTYIAIYSNLYGATGAPQIVSYPQSVNLRLLDYKLSPNGAYLVQRLQNPTTGFKWLFVSSVFGGPLVPYALTSAFNANWEVLDYQISPDSTQVVYRVRMIGTGSTQLYSAPILSGPATPLAGAVGGTAVTVQDDYKIAADSLRVVFRENKIFPYTFTGMALVSARLDGSSYTVLENFPSFGLPAVAISDFEVSADAAYVVYRKGIGSPIITQLYSLPVAGGTSVRLSLSAPSSTSNVAADYAISLNAATVVFKAANVSTDTQDLYSVPIRAGISPVPLVPFGGLLFPGKTISQFAISPDSSRVVSLNDKFLVGAFVLYSTPIGGGTSVKFTSSSDIISFAISPDSAYVVFPSDTLYSAPLAGGTITPLTPAATPGAGRYRISPDSSRVVFIGANGALYSNRITGGTATKLSGTMVAGGSVGSFVGGSDGPFNISPNSARVVFSADKETDNTFELYSSKIDGGGVFLDIDGDGKVLPTTDVLMLVRASLGVSAPDVVAGATGTGATRFTNITVPPYIAQVQAEAGGLALDIDGNCSVDLNTDLVLLTRYLLGMRDSNLTAGALGLGATRSATQIATYIVQLLEKPACTVLC